MEIPAQGRDDESVGRDNERQYATLNPNIPVVPEDATQLSGISLALLFNSKRRHMQVKMPLQKLTTYNL
ncbi:hypothetical protein GCM10011338_18890 [Alteromonas lipolytica]|uniref:Uncharacterized protein n=1 Tax=Alteromonas lipolytica TaxID=1856405 RepID=A0A1E8FDW8_9ALTE|nr:hypothetical protein BFC17_20565 [Alteromonas lipolytica]GGF66934.1 hypothetical protein GCM10011338_18890 [Alteromonas lipolytica]